MYWTDKTGKQHIITQMTTEDLINCKRLLERTDIRIGTLRYDSDKYMILKTINKEHDVSYTYDYTSNPEYRAIYNELKRWEQLMCNL